MIRDDFSLCSIYLGSNIMLCLHAEHSWCTIEEYVLIFRTLYTEKSKILHIKVSIYQIVFVSFLVPLKTLSFWYIETFICSILDFSVYNVLKIKTYSSMVHQLCSAWRDNIILLPRYMLHKLKSSHVIRLRPNLSLCVLTSDCICYLSFSWRIGSIQWSLQ
jgi:hypothetical protein